MPRLKSLLPLVLLSSCASHAPSPAQGPLSPQNCEESEATVRALYLEAAESEGVASNLQSDYLQANVQMTMNDCRLDPNRVIACLHRAKSAEQIENRCLTPLDEAGTTEGKLFAQELTK